MGIDSITLGAQAQQSRAPQRQVQVGRHVVIFRKPRENRRHSDYADSWVESYSFNPFTNEEYVNGHRSPYYRGARSYYELPVHLQTDVRQPYVPTNKRK